MKSWSFPPDTTEIPEDQYAPIDIIDISDFHLADEPLPSNSDPSKQADIINRAFRALREVSFMAIKGHGLSSEHFHHQFDLGRMLLEDVHEDEKHNLHAKISEGEWAGYKPTGYYKRPDGGADTIEHFDTYPFTMRVSGLPDVAKPIYIGFAFIYQARSTTTIVFFGDCLLYHLSEWDSHKMPFGIYTTEVALQMMGCWILQMTMKLCGITLRIICDMPCIKHLWIPGHTDLGSLTFLYSQPIAGLQVLSPDGVWRYIRHYPEHIIVNVGDSLEFLTGGLLKAVPHRVMEPPSDQRHLNRLGVFYFVPFLPEVPLQPLDSLIVAHADKFEVKDPFEEYRRLGGKQLNSNGGHSSCICP
ncbi:hypothetical protein C8J56DRAFT_1049246 [Mycena floridula]|nr:hypothetical protein C8J56DRAFT_1049246 [Mycena floridula]